ncbi:MAG: tetratricopeptide repeat protein, partial [Parvibaculaceae bacterium]|nr:tetratricopeptide repeat protein [Parvibaculaceae bacterium]
MPNQAPKEALGKKVDSKSATGERIWQQAEKLFASGHKEQALARYKRFLDHHPDDVTALMRVGAIILQIGDPQEALPYFHKVANLDPDKASNQFNLAINYNRLGDTDEGKRYTDITLELDPNYVKALIQRASDKLSKELYEDTLEITARILTLEPENTLAYQLRLSCLGDMGRIEDLELTLAEMEKN